VNSITEATAKTRWCPYVRLMPVIGSTGSLVPGGAAFNRAPGIVSAERYGEDLCCLGSSCMAWRWDTDTLVDNMGHCGLAGGADVRTNKSS
jgi:hypothetical protein